MERPSRWRSAWRLVNEIVRCNLHCHSQAASVAGNKTWGYHYFTLTNTYELTKSNSHVSKHFHDNASYVSVLGHNPTPAAS